MLLFIIPASPIFVGVFDKDPIGDHDPVGRIVINISNVQDNTTCILNYALHHHSDPNKVNDNNNDTTNNNDGSNINDAYNNTNKKKYDRGTITVRLRIEWYSQNIKMKRVIQNKSPIKQQPSRKIFLNVSTKKSFHLVKYLCRGEIDMEKSSMDSVRAYMNEFNMHIDDLFYLADDFLRVLLWRGRIQVHLRRPFFLLTNEDDVEVENDMDAKKVMTVSLWFPIRSMVLFQTVLIMIERPRLIPGLSFCLIGTVLFRFMVTRSRHPLPWNRCKVRTKSHAF